MSGERRATFTKVFFKRDLSDLKLAGPLARIFRLLSSVVLNKYSKRKDLFANGCGKLLMYELLTVDPERDYLVAVSTTNNQFSDWCGIYFEGLEISGVVDVMVRSCTNSRIVIGEVKGARTSYEEGLWQLVASMETVNCFAKSWPLGEF